MWKYIVPMCLLFVTTHAFTIREPVNNNGTTNSTNNTQLGPDKQFWTTPSWTTPTWTTPTWTTPSWTTPTTPNWGNWLVKI